MILSYARSEVQPFTCCSFFIVRSPITHWKIACYSLQKSLATRYIWNLVLVQHSLLWVRTRRSFSNNIVWMTLLKLSLPNYHHQRIYSQKLAVEKKAFLSSCKHIEGNFFPLLMIIHQLPWRFKLILDWLGEGGRGAEFHFFKLPYIIKEKLYKNIAESQFPVLSSIVGLF